MDVSFWCSARTGTPWAWSPQWYPGVWAFLLAILAAYLFALRRVGPSRGPRGEPVVSRSRLAAFAAGFGLLWLSLDWPVGALGAGYLLSVHMVQYVLISLVAVPLLERGMPDWMCRELLAAPPMAPLRWLAERPFAAFVLFNAVMFGTHLPVVADALKPLQFGSMAIDLLWIAAAAAFWLSLRGLGGGELDAVYGRRLLYIVGVKVLPMFLGAFFVFAEFPLFRTYELAARPVDITATDDQLLAGVVVWMGATPILLFRLGLAFLTWYALESRRAGEV